MNEQQIPCPYCKTMIDKNAEQCPNCHEYFKEISIPLKIDSLGKFIVYNIMTLAFYQFAWLVFNLKNIDKMIIKEKDKKKLNAPIIALALLGLICILNTLTYGIYDVVELPQTFVILHFLFGTYVVPIFVIAGTILTYIITYRILRIIERYTKNKFGIEITHSEMGWLFCPVLCTLLLSPMFYMAYFIYTYKERVYNPKPITM